MRFNAWQQILKGGARNLIHAPPIAIDFGAGALKVLQISPGDPPTLVAAACIETPMDLLSDPARRLTFQLDALPGLLKSCEFKGRRAVCALPASRTFCKHMQFQQEPGVPLATLIKAAVPAQLKCDPDALVYRHVEVGPVARSAKTEVICMAAARDMVERFMQAMKTAKLEPVGMQSEFTAALRAFDSITRRSEDSAMTSLYLDIGYGCTKVAMAHGRDLVFARVIDLGGRHLDAAVARQLKVDVSAARFHRLQMTQLTRSKAPAARATTEEPRSEERLTGRLAVLGGEGTAPAAVDTAAATMDDRREGKAPAGHTDLAAANALAQSRGVDLSEPLEILTDEISMCLRYHESIFPERRVDRAIFIGGEARHLGLCQHIARTLRLPAQVADPLARLTRTGEETSMGVDLSKGQPGWAVALGLCLCPTDL